MKPMFSPQRSGHLLFLPQLNQPRHESTEFRNSSCTTHFFLRNSIQWIQAQVPWFLMRAVKEKWPEQPCLKALYQDRIVKLLYLTFKGHRGINSLINYQGLNFYLSFKQSYLVRSWERGIGGSTSLENRPRPSHLIKHLSPLAKSYRV